MNQNQSNDIRVRQADGSNYSPETTSADNPVTPVNVIWDEDDGTTQIGSLTFTSLGLYRSGTFNGKPLFENVGFDSDNNGTIDSARIYFDFDDSKYKRIRVANCVK